MSMFDKDAFNQFIIENEVVGFFDKAVTLKSGRTSHWYVNWRTLSSDVYLVDQLADHLMCFANDNHLNPDMFYGVPEGATKLGIIATYKLAKASPNFKVGSFRLSMGRGRPKEHGVPKDRYFVGEPEGRVVVVEDVTTTGGSLLDEIDKLKDAGVDVVASIGLTNRMELTADGQSVEDAVNAKGVPYYSLSEATSFLPEAYKILNPHVDIAKAIESEFREYGVRPIALIP